MSSYAASTPARAPALPLLLAETPHVFRLHFGRHVPRARAKVGAGRPVLVLPGFLANDRSTRMLRAGLAEAGFDAHGWGMGRNLGVRADTLDRIDALARRIAANNPAPLTIVGWSLGGLIAREYAKRAPDRIARVVTLGSPFSGDLRANNAWRLYEWVARHPVDAPPIDCRLAEKPPVETIALWSGRDGVVCAASARGERGEVDRERELQCSHLGFALDPQAIDAVIETVAA
ncbi:alpha/beta fold hydrolase [Sphingomonas gilva]|uniref:Alpha/beta fold hydrolase n=1 Tax=Sphingomonas gilva TaxID=2305907 RepID=A0A396RMG8_9SPHN|nr:alpha/beta fold hydrolase [Sphingomonas gilva]RHW17590.1 alpha/beta fold hydrolase [Sphingomonas gilva]